MSKAIHEKAMKKNVIMTEELLKEIKLCLTFAVPAAEQPAAVELADKYRKNELALRLLHSYYTVLPDAREEAVVRLSALSSREGVHFFVVSSVQSSWLYAITVEDVVLIAEYGQEVPSDVVDFFGYSSQKEFWQNCPDAKEMEEYPAAGTGLEHCPACGVSEGEVHVLGCVVELCPWCDSQLRSCGCRFEKTGLEEIENEEQLEDFVEQLEEKGRIPFSREQAPAYPGTSKGFDC